MKTLMSASNVFIIMFVIFFYNFNFCHLIKIETKQISLLLCIKHIYDMLSLLHQNMTIKSQDLNKNRCKVVVCQSNKDILFIMFSKRYVLDSYNLFLKCVASHTFMALLLYLITESNFCCCEVKQKTELTVIS